MIMTRTPFRVSFVGGGTDFPEWFMEHGGEVLSTTIERYCYIMADWLGPYYACRHRVVWSHVETPLARDDIEHPAVRAVMRNMGFNGKGPGLEVHHRGDLPARSGIGSSSSFVVGILAALYRLRDGFVPGMSDLAFQAIRIERELLREAGGWQDQVAVAHGGLNHIVFSAKGSDPAFEVCPLHPCCLPELEARLMLVWTGVTRTGPEVAETVAADLEAKAGYLKDLAAMVPDAVRQLEDGRLDDFGDLLAEAWQAKKMVGDVTTPELDELYWAARKAGARGGKVMGSGRGGFMLLYADERVQAKVRRALKGRPVISPVLFSSRGAEVVYAD